MRKILIISIVLIFTNIYLLFPQTGQTGAIKGIVTFIDGNPKSDVIVTASSPELISGEISTITRKNGLYFLKNLHPGKYNISYKSIGLPLMIQKGVSVNANTTTNLNVHMIWNNSRETIELKKAIPTIDKNSITNTTTIDKELISSVPTNRTLKNYLMMTPSITGDFEYISSLGSTVRDNIYLLDGINIIDPSIGTNRLNFSTDIINEISIQTSGSNAEQSGGRGAIINIITKSGSNKLKGAASIYYDHGALHADNDINTKFKFEAGFSLGGSILKNKLWYFLNLNAFSLENYVAGYPFGGKSEIPTDLKNFLPYFKLTTQPNDRNKIILSYNFIRTKENHVSASQYFTEEATWIAENHQHIFSAHWTHHFTTNFFSNFKIGYFKDRLEQLTKTDKGAGYDSLKRFFFGSYGWDELNSLWRFQTNIDGTLFIDNLLGSHEFKFGGKLNLNLNQKIVSPKYDVTDQIGIPRYFSDWIDDYAEWGCFYIGFNKKEITNNIGFFINDTWNVYQNLTLNLGLRLDIQRGIVPRQNQKQYLSKGNLAHVGLPDANWNFNIQQSQCLYNWITWSPRLGFVYDLKGDGKTLVKGTYSRFFQENLMVWLDDLIPINWLGYEAHLNPDGSIDYIYKTQIPGTNQAGYKQFKMKAPFTDEMTLGIEKELWENWSIGIRYIRRWDRNLLETVDANSLDIDTLMDEGKLLWTNWEKVEGTNPFDGSTITLWNQKQYLPKNIYIVNPPGTERNYRGIEFHIKKRYSDGWMLNISYVGCKSEGLIGNDYLSSEGNTDFYINPNRHINAFGHMPMERQHQFKIIGLIKGFWGINFSGFFSFFSGPPFTVQVHSRYLGLNLFQGDETVYAEPQGSKHLSDQFFLDFRIEKTFRIKKGLLKIFVDTFNLFNGKQDTRWEGISSNPSIKLEEYRISVNPRKIRLGAKIEF